ncbi:hypothetical protein [Phenylobacterium sp.]|jgi:hypothetical protein|uniref:hypothetical protein n=1 Tax=Phenylobacterium sp. TaxID=1871053 RepID=UPI002E31E89B|nr:hypothetical protein [Phenylobacterium sp.]HEX3363942.1 hypothetical protein [Phenylobacterium sp.]
MNRIVILAAAAATLLAAPAYAGDSIRISVVGKTPEQLRAEVYVAARRLCASDVVGSSFPLDEMRACVSRTVDATLAQMHDPAVKVAAR